MGSQWRDDWWCRIGGGSCTKTGSVELHRYEQDLGPDYHSWTPADCQKKCEDYGKGCDGVVMETYEENAVNPDGNDRAWTHYQKSCILFLSSKVMKPHKKITCHRDHLPDNPNDPNYDGGRMMSCFY